MDTHTTQGIPKESLYTPDIFFYVMLMRKRCVVTDTYQKIHSKQG